MRLLRSLFLLTVGFWAGVMGSAALVKRALPSRGDEESDTVALVSVLDGVTLKSHATAFRGGSLLSWFGGIAIDLREAQLAPHARLDVHSLFGGVAIRVPPGWRIVSSMQSLGGGVAIDVPEPEEATAPTLTLDGFTVFGGVAVAAKQREPETTTP